MIIRLLAGLIGLFHASNGLAMLLAPTIWWARAPGALDTGPYNPHFVADVGLAFLASGLAFLAFAWRPKLKLVALGASGFLVFHSGLHLWGVLAHDHTDNLLVDFGAVMLPAVVGLALAWPRTGEI